jgi:hypothetical protein
MILKEFGSGWQERFESRLQDLLTLFPDIELINVERFHGMLRVQFDVPDQRIDYIIKAVSYKIERESAQTCEQCGGSGRRKEEYLSEKLCLCWKCYAIEIDKILHPLERIN